MKGFSTNTCLPFSQRRLRQLEVRPHRRDDRDRIDVGRFQDFGELRRQVDPGIGRLARRRASGLLSHTATTSQFSRLWKFRTMFGPQ